MTQPGDPRRGFNSKQLNRFLTIPASHLCELVRWMLDRGCIPYCEYGSAPVLHFLAFRRAGAGSGAMPILITSEATLTDMRSALVYIDARLPKALRLYPDDAVALKKTEDLLVLLLDTLSLATRNYGYSLLLQHREILVPLWKRGIPGWQKYILGFAFPLIAKMMRRDLPAAPEHTAPNQKQIETVFAELDALLADGRPYLLGDKPTLVDYCFAALSAPVILPEQYGGEFPAFDELPEAYRQFCLRLRTTKAGVLALKMYREQRPARQPTPSHHPTSTTPKNFFSYYLSRVVATLTGPAIQRELFKLLRKYKPVIVFGKRAIVLRDADVRETLARDTEFTISEINGPNMLRLNGPFFLGMDRSETYSREQGALRHAIEPGDAELIRSIVRRHCDDMIKAAVPLGRIDVVSQLTRPVARRFIADYLGVSGPDEVTMMRWMRSLFHDLFLNLGNDKHIQAAAEQSYREMKPYLLGLIDQRRQQILGGEKANDLLSRLIKLKNENENFLDDDGIRRNISGLIVGALDTTSMTSTLIIDLLLSRPEFMRRTRAAMGDPERLLHVCFDVLRFNTMAGAMRRHCEHGATIAGVNIPKKTEVFVSTASAMFDELAWPEPNSLRDDRPLGKYLHFGDAMHRCFGEYINRVQIPIIVESVLSLGNLRRCGNLLYDGPFPDQMVLEFEK